MPRVTRVIQVISRAWNYCGRAWLQSRLSAFSKDFGQRCPHNKFKDVSKRYLCYRKKRKRKQSRHGWWNEAYSGCRKTSRSNGRATRQGRRTPVSSRQFSKAFSNLRRVLEQEKALFSGQKVSDRIVSVNKPHVRPIVRSKETKNGRVRRKIKARQEETEILWIFFGIHVANVACTVEKVKKKEKRNTTWKNEQEKVAWVQAPKVMSLSQQFTTLMGWKKKRWTRKKEKQKNCKSKILLFFPIYWISLDKIYK